MELIEDKLQVLRLLLQLCFKLRSSGLWCHVW